MKEPKTIAGGDNGGWVLTLSFPCPLWISITHERLTPIADNRLLMDSPTVLQRLCYPCFASIFNDFQRGQHAFNK